MKLQKGQFIVLFSGIAGAGKRSVAKVLKDDANHFCYAVSCTTRPKRHDEVEGVDYHFLTNEEFDQGIENGDFVEWENVHQYRYGCRKSDLLELLDSGRIPLLEIDVKGAQNFKNIFGKGIISIFIMPPSLDVVIERLKNRNTETEEDIKIRSSRYEMELSYKDKYDHIIINDDLEKAQKELIEIIKKEVLKRKRNQNFLETLNTFISLLFVAIFLGYGLARAVINSKPKTTAKTTLPEIVQPNTETKLSEDQPAATTTATPESAKEETKKRIAATPPKNSAPKTAPIETTTNSNGTQTTTVATAGISDQSEITRLSQLSASPSNPLQIIFQDTTGIHPEVAEAVRNYINSTLKWRNEISAMKEIKLENAGDSGWNGEYLGSYTISADGKDITSAYGSIILNTYYVDNNYCKGYEGNDCFLTYMKYIVSHEYGHHYTLYHKWVDLDLRVGVRFPDEYYTIRPLSKTATATDYSKGWSNCELEIIAEDYSYLYSGFGAQSMAATYGYPSASVKTWLNTLGEKAAAAEEVATTTPTEPTTPPAAAPADTENPTIVITEPATAEITLPANNLLSLKINASDNVGVAKIEVYFEDNLQQSYNYSSLSLNVNFKSLPSGTYHLKFKAYDDAGNSAETILTVIKN